MAKSDDLVFNLHQSQTDIFFDNRRVQAAISGIQGGKSTLGAFWLADRIANCKDKDAAFVVAAPTYKIMQQSTLPCIFSIWPAFSYTYQKIDGTLTMLDGRKVYLRSGTDPNAAEGIQKVGAVWVDEAGMCTRLFWVNLQARTSFMKAPILLTSTPYAMNWLKKEVIDAYEKGGRDDILYRRWASRENPAFPSEEYDRQKQILDARTFRRKYEGIHEKMEGLVYEDLGRENWCEPFSMPQGTQTYAGVDWGYKHAFAMTVRCITPEGRHFTVSEFKQSGLDPTEKVAVAKGKMQVLGIKHFYCGADRPEMIDMFNDAGLPSSASYAGQETRYREILPGIEAHSILIKSNRYQIFTGRCPHLEDEYETYHWEEQKNEEREARERPVDINDDLMSAERYVTVGTLHVYSKLELPKQKWPQHKVDLWTPKKKRSRVWA